MTPPEVIVYTTPTCPYCTVVKEFLSKNNVVYEEKNVAVDKAALKEMLGYTGRSAVPTVKIGDEVIVGFDKARITQLLDL